VDDLLRLVDTVMNLSYDGWLYVVAVLDLYKAESRPSMFKNRGKDNLLEE
jgi:hypothetical protein